MKHIAVGIAFAFTFAGCGGGGDSDPGTRRAQLLAEMRAKATAAATAIPTGTAPTITLGVANAASTIVDSVLIPWDSGKFFYSGNVSVAGTTFPDRALGENKAVSYGPGILSSNFLTIEFTTDAPALEVLVKGTAFNGRMRFMVDGALASATPVEYPDDGSLRLTKLVFGTRAMRRIRILSNAPKFGGVRVGPADVVSLPPADTGFRAMFVGDSITEGPAGQAAQTSFAPIAAQLLGWSDAWISGVGATGYLEAPSPRFTFRQRFDADIRAYAPDVLVIAGGVNDTGFTDAQIHTEAGLLFDRIQQDLPNTLVFVLGPWNPRMVVRAGVNTAIKTAAAGRPNFFWVPNYDEPWITGTGTVGAPTGDGNSDIFTSPGGLHPSPAGIDYYARKFKDAITVLIR